MSKTKKLNVSIILCKCMNGELFGIRFEQYSNSQWLGTWSFKISESLAKKENYENTTLKGKFGFADSYPGCPYCKRKTFFQCSCGKINCWDGESTNVTCNWCNRNVILDFDNEVNSIDANNDY